MIGASAVAFVTNEACKHTIELIEEIGDRRPTDDEIRKYIALKEACDLMFTEWMKEKAKDGSKADEILALLEGTVETLHEKYPDVKSAKDMTGEEMVCAAKACVAPFLSIAEMVKKDIDDFDLDLFRKATEALVEFISREDTMDRVVDLADA